MSKTTAKKYKLGLVLGGGGARGFAHLGVIQAMSEMELKPDIISGTSAGAIVGAMISAGRSPEESLHFFTSKKMLNLARPTVSKMGLMIMAGMEEHLKIFLQKSRFEELDIPLVITVSNINAAVPEHFESGELIPYIIASCSIPVVFVPVEIDGNTYVDGGVFMNLPVRPIRERCEKIIAVEINSIDTNEKISNVIHMAERSFHLSAEPNTQIDKELADILIIPQNIAQYSMFSLEYAMKIYEEGYKTARKALSDFKLNE